MHGTATMAKKMTINLKLKAAAEEAVTTAAEAMAAAAPVAAAMVLTSVLDFLIRTYVQKLHMIAKQAFSNWRNLNSPHGRFASEVSRAKHQLDYSKISNHLYTTTLS